MRQVGWKNDSPHITIAQYPEVLKRIMDAASDMVYKILNMQMPSVYLKI